MRHQGGGKKKKKKEGDYLSIFKKENLREIIIYSVETSRN